MTVTNLERRRI